MSEGDDRSGPATEETSTAAAVRGMHPRGRPAVAASILGALLIGGYLAAAPGGVRMATGEYLLHAALLAVAFWIPALRIGSVGELVARWKGLLAWVLAATLVWDLATSGILFGARDFFEAWWLVYPAGVLVLGGLLLLHGAVMGWTTRRRGEVES